MQGQGTESLPVLDPFFSNEAEMVEGVITNVPLDAGDHSVLEFDFREPHELPVHVSALSALLT